MFHASELMKKIDSLLDEFVLNFNSAGNLGSNRELIIKAKDYY